MKKYFTPLSLFFLLLALLAACSQNPGQEVSEF